MWHGSGQNKSSTLPRRAIGIHLVRHDVEFHRNEITYIYGRYKLSPHDYTLNENFFPITYAEDGSRSPWLERYCGDALVYSWKKIK